LSPYCADLDAPAGVGHYRRWFVRTPDEFDEPGRSAAVDPLAWLINRRAFDCGKLLLHGVSFYADSRPGATRHAGAMALAQASSVEMARGWIACGLFMGL